MDIGASLAHLIDGFKLLVSDPAELIRREKPKKSIVKGLVSLFILSMLAVVLFVVQYLFFTPSFPGLMQAMMSAMVCVMVFVYPVIFVILFLFVALVLFVLMKVLAGKGSFEELFYLMAVIVAPVYFAVTVGFAIIASPLLGLLNLEPLSVSSIAFGMLFLFIESIIPLFMLHLVIKEVGQFSTSRSVICWGSPTALIALVYISMMLLTLQMASTGAIANTKVDGFNVVKPQFNSVITPKGGDGALMMLSMVNTKADATLDNASVIVSKDGRQCKVDFVGTFGFSSFEKNTANSITFKTNMPSFLMINILGPGCGGDGGQAFRYEISMEMQQDGKRLTNSGTLSGKYSLQGQPFGQMGNNQASEPNIF
jgi:hypothetical protein